MRGMCSIRQARERKSESMRATRCTTAVGCGMPMARRLDFKQIAEFLGFLGGRRGDREGT